MRAVAVGLVLASAYVAGCLAPGSVGPPTGDGVQAAAWPSSHPLIAIVDSGINPYHAMFQDPSPWIAAAVRELRGPDGAPPTVLQLAQEGDYAARVQADRAAWDAIPPGQLVWFEGTRVLGLAAAPRDGEPIPILDEFGHGTGVASIAARAAPHALILMVEAAVLNLEHPLVLYGAAAPALRAVADLGTVDVLSLSIGPPASLPAPGGDAITAATRLAAERGLLVVAAAGNQPTHPITNPFVGPPWVVSVSGVHEEAGGRTAVAAAALDVVAEFYATYALHDSVDGVSQEGGTSFGAPLVAAVAAEALHALRQAGWEGNASDLRPLLNATADDWGLADWRLETNHTDPGDLLETLTLPILLPWQQMGWGHVGPEHVAAIVGAVTGEAPPAPKPPEAVAWMAAQQAAREAYWSLPQPAATGRV